jgi:hypothetical protein
MLQKTIKKPSRYKRAYIGFAAKWLRFTAPMKDEILSGVRKGRPASQVVHRVFSKHNAKEKLKTLVMDSVVESVKISGVRLR